MCTKRDHLLRVKVHLLCTKKKKKEKPKPGLKVSRLMSLTQQRSRNIKNIQMNLTAICQTNKTYNTILTTNGLTVVAQPLVKI